MILISHLYYGDPSKEFSDKLAETLLMSGTDILEVGIPYTDPVCDGEIFQRACQRALQNGTTPLDVLEGIKSRISGIHDAVMRKNLQTASGQLPIYLTSYYAPIFKIGVEHFIKRAKEAGVTGLIIPDILLEEQDELRKMSKRHELSVIQFATVYSTKERLQEIIKASTDFIYCVSRSGVTGDKGEVTQLRQLLQLLKQLTEKPIYVGFGVKSPEDAKEILRMGADGIIVGSAIARIYEKNINSPEKTLPKISTFIKALKAIQ